MATKEETGNKKMYPVPNDQEPNTETSFSSGHGKSPIADLDNAKPTTVKRSGHRI